MLAYISLGLIWLAAFTALGADGEVASNFFGAPLLLIGAWVAFRDRWLGFGTASLVGVFALFLVMAILQGQWQSGEPEFVGLGACGAVFLTARSFARQGPKPSTISAVLLGFFLLAAVLAFVDYIWSPDQIFLFDKPYHLGRLSTPFLSANTAATFFGIGIILTVGRLLRVATGYAGEAKWKHLILPIASLLFCASCLILTASRAGILLTGGFSALLLLWETARRFQRGKTQSIRLIAFAGIGIAITTACILSLSGETFSSRITEGIDGVGSRTELWVAYRGALLDHFWFGAGFGGFEYVNAISANAENASILIFQRAAHNVVLQWLVQTGAVGLLTLIAFWLAVGRKIAGDLRHSGRARWMIRTLVCVGLFVLAHGMVDYALEIPAIAWLVSWLAGLACGWSPARAKPGMRPLRYAVAAAFGGLGILALINLADGLGANAVRTASGPAATEILATPFPDGASLSMARAHADLALRSTPANPQHALAALTQALALEPRDGRAEARLAYAYLLSGDSRSAAGHLERSYALWPYAHPDFRAWRLELAAALWNRLDNDQRTAPLQELRQVRPEWRQAWLSTTHACEVDDRSVCIGLMRDQDQLSLDSFPPLR